MHTFDFLKNLLQEGHRNFGRLLETAGQSALGYTEFKEIKVVSKAWLNLPAFWIDLRTTYLNKQNISTGEGGMFTCQIKSCFLQRVKLQNLLGSLTKKMGRCSWIVNGTWAAVQKASLGSTCKDLHMGLLASFLPTCSFAHCAVCWFLNSSPAASFKQGYQNVPSVIRQPQLVQMLLPRFSWGWGGGSMPQQCPVPPAPRFAFWVQFTVGDI